MLCTKLEKIKSSNSDGVMEISSDDIVGVKTGPGYLCVGNFENYKHFRITNMNLCPFT